MPTRAEPWPTGTPCWVDLATSDIAAAREFYGALFGWTFTDTGEDFGNYHVCLKNGHGAAGMAPLMNESDPVGWTVYLASDDVDHTAKLIAENGGTVVIEAMDIPGNGRMAIAVDSQGAMFGVWQAAGMNGVGIYNEPGSLTWNDARMPDADDARKFYAAVFGFQYQQVEMAPGDYTTFHGDGGPLGGMGGMMGAPDGTPAHWLTYFSVADAAEAAEAAKRAGGTVTGELVETPYGPMVWITDPQGAQFVVIGPAPSAG